MFYNKNIETNTKQITRIIKLIINSYFLLKQYYRIIIIKIVQLEKMFLFYHQLVHIHPSRH